MPKPKLIAIDIDGTLIDSKTGLRPDVESAILRAKADGAMVTLATGRMISAAREFIDRLDIDLPIIALNGSLVAADNGDSPLYHEPISSDSSRLLVERAWETPSTLIFICCDKAFTRNITDITGPALETWIANITDFPDSSIIASSRPTCILVAGEQAEIGDIYDATKSLNLCDIEHYMFPSIRYFHMHYIEYRAKGTNKGTALRILRESLGIQRKDVLAIGDYLNDLPMAEEAGIFAAPANARIEVQELADYVSPLTNDQGAVAQILEHLYFNANY